MARILRLLPGIALASLPLLLGSCAVPLGPRYTIEKQSLDVHFIAEPQPHIEIRAWYRLVNTGNQALHSILIRLPNRQSYDVSNIHARLDGNEVANHSMIGGASETSQITFESPWAQKQPHELILSYDVSRGITRQALTLFSADDSFYLSPGGWCPELQPPKGTFAKLNGPRRSWEFTLRIPEGFAVHASGHERGTKKSGGEIVHRFEQQSRDYLPFAIAGRYQVRETRVAGKIIVFWTRHSLVQDDARRIGDYVAQIASGLDAVLGARASHPETVWVVECPCSGRTVGLAVPEGASAAALSTYGPIPDAALIDEDGVSSGTIPSVASKFVPSWLGLPWGLTQERLSMPIAELGSYASSVAELSAGRQETREHEIAGLLAQFDSGRASEAKGIENEKERNRWLQEPEKKDPFKSLLFFFALEDQYGREPLHHAIARMIHARRGRGYDLDDLRSALEAEAGQSVAEFFRRWLDQPGIPGDFRARYLQAGPSTTNTPKEKQP